MSQQGDRGGLFQEPVHGRVSRLAPGPAGSHSSTRTSRRRLPPRTGQERAMEPRFSAGCQGAGVPKRLSRARGADTGRFPAISASWATLLAQSRNDARRGGWRWRSRAVDAGARQAASGTDGRHSCDRPRRGRLLPGELAGPWRSVPCTSANCLVSLVWLARAS